MTQVRILGISMDDGEEREVIADTSARKGSDFLGKLVPIELDIDSSMSDLYTNGVYTGYKVKPGDLLQAPTNYFVEVGFDGTPGQPYVALFLEADLPNWWTGQKAFAKRQVTATNLPQGNIQYPNYSSDSLRFVTESRLMIGIYQDLGSGNVGQAHPSKGKLEARISIMAA